MTLLVQYTLIYASVLILVALGGCFAEHSGVINLGLEGIMIMGALGGALTLKYLCAAWQGVPAIVLILSAVLVAALVGLIYSLLLSVACGEHPQAANSVGISVYKMRYAGVMISGVLGGIGGIAYITAGVSEWKFEGGVAGFGFLALAVMIFGQWKPTRIALAALLFGLFRALSNVYSGIGFLANLNISSSIYNMMPYVISLIVLAFTSKKSRAPKAEGIPYDKGQR